MLRGRYIDSGKGSEGGKQKLAKPPILCLNLLTNDDVKARVLQGRYHITPDRGGMMVQRDESELEGKRVLIADDEPDVLETLEELLSMCKVVKAATHEEAKRELETQPFDFAILDIMGVDGYKLLEIAVEKDITVVMLTAHALTPQDTVRSFREGAASYVPKDEMNNIPTFLLDILDAKKKGKSLWWRWMDRMDAYYKAKFGPDWKSDDKDFWNRFTFYT